MRRIGRRGNNIRYFTAGHQGEEEEEEEEEEQEGRLEVWFMYTPVRKVLAQKKVLWQSLGYNPGTGTRVCQTIAAQIMMMWLRHRGLLLIGSYNI